jgi:hypothetical protein
LAAPVDIFPDLGYNFFAVSLGFSYPYFTAKVGRFRPAFSLFFFALFGAFIDRAVFILQQPPDWQIHMSLPFSIKI